METFQSSSSFHLPFPTSLPTFSLSTTTCNGRLPHINIDQRVSSSIIAPSSSHDSRLSPFSFAQTSTSCIASPATFHDSRFPPSNIAQSSFSSFVSSSSFHTARTSHLPAQATAPVSPSLIQFGNVSLPISSSSNLSNLSSVTSTQATLLIPTPSLPTQSNSLFSGQQSHPLTITASLYNDFSKTLPPWVNNQAFLPSQSLQEMLQKNINDRWSSFNNGLPCLQSSVSTVSVSQPCSSPPSGIPQHPSLLSACAVPPPPRFSSTSLTSAAPPLLSIPPISSPSIVSQPSSTLPARAIPPPKDRQSLHL